MVLASEWKLMEADGNNADKIDSITTVTYKKADFLRLFKQWDLFLASKDNIHFIQFCAMFNQTSCCRSCNTEWWNIVTPFGDSIEANLQMLQQDFNI